MKIFKDNLTKQLSQTVGSKIVTLHISIYNLYVVLDHNRLNLYYLHICCQSNDIFSKPVVAVTTDLLFGFVHGHRRRRKGIPLVVRYFARLEFHDDR